MGLQMAKVVDSKANMVYFYGAIAGVYEKKADYKNAYEFMQKVSEIQSEFNKEELSSKVKQLETDFQVQQKQSELLEKDLELTKSENQKPEILTYENLIASTIINV